MEIYTFKGLDKRMNIIGGFVAGFTVFFILAIGFWIFNHYIHSFFSALFFLISHTFIGITVYQLLLSKHMSKEWKATVADDFLEMNYNNSYGNKIFFKDISHVKIANKTTIRRYLEINLIDKKKIVSQIQSYPFIKKDYFNQFDQLCGNLSDRLNKNFKEVESKSQGYNIQEFFKN